MLSFRGILLFGFKPLGKGVLLSIFSYWLSLETARCCFLGSKSIFHLQITGVCYNITSPVTGKSTDLAFKFGKIVGVSLFDIDK